MLMEEERESQRRHSAEASRGNVTLGDTVPQDPDLDCFVNTEDSMGSNWHKFQLPLKPQQRSKENIVDLHTYCNNSADKKKKTVLILYSVVDT